MGGFLALVYYIVWNESKNPDKDDDNEDENKENKDKNNKRKEKDGYLLLNNNEDLDI